MDRFEQVAGAAIPQMGSQLLGQLRQDGNVPALAALGFGDEDHLLIEEQLVHLDVHKLRHPGAGLEERFDEQAPRSLHAVGVRDEPPLFIA